MPRYTKKPVMIEATRITQSMTVNTLEGTMKGEPGDWLITGVMGEHHFCKDDIFRATYDPVGKDDEEYVGWANPDLSIKKKERA